MEKINAYRAIPMTEGLLELYKSDPDKIPGIEGTHFVSLNHNNKCNTCTYDPTKKYLHFFPDKKMAEKYAEALSDGISRSQYSPVDVAVVGFYFPEEILKNFLFKGFYESKYGETKVQEEYIVPLELYDPNLNLGKIEEVVKSKYRYDPDDYGPMF